MQALGQAGSADPAALAAALQLAAEWASGGGDAASIRVLPALQWMTQVAARLGPDDCPAEAGAALRAALRCAGSSDPDARGAALRAACALVQAGAAAALLVADAGLSAHVLDAALSSMHDVDAAVAAQAERLLLAAAGPLALGALGAGVASSSSSDEPAPWADGVAAELAVAAALQPQQCEFSAAQLEQLLDFLAGGAPQAAAVLAGGSAPLREAGARAEGWVQELVHALAALPAGEADEGQYDGPRCQPE
jgi:hypothetical protein